MNRAECDQIIVYSVLRYVSQVIFMSARVHPGETPASFILNGFLKMILDRKSRYAAVLR